MKRISAALVLIIGGVALAGCTPAAVAAPEVSWQGGKPSGTFESDPWVEAVRASDLALNAAIVTRDYTGEDLQATTSTTAIKRVASAQRSSAEGDRFFTSPGPTPMIPLSVDEEGDEAVVTVCQAQDWYLDADQTSAPEDLKGQVAEFRVVLRDGDQRRSEGGAVRAEECDLTGASIGLFDPQPDPTETYSPDDVKAPR